MIKFLLVSAVNVATYSWLSVEDFLIILNLKVYTFHSSCLAFVFVQMFVT